MNIFERAQTIIGEVSASPDTKSWWQSKGVLGGVASVVAGALGLAGYTLNADALTLVLTDGAAVVAGVIAVIGRVQATKIVKM